MQHWSTSVTVVVTWPLPQHKLSQESECPWVTLHCLPFVPIIPWEESGSQKVGEVFKFTRSFVSLRTAIVFTATKSPDVLVVTWTVGLPRMTAAISSAVGDIL